MMKMKVNCVECNDLINIDISGIEDAYHKIEGNYYCGNCAATCIWCDGSFIPGEDGNELGFCMKCSTSDKFPYDLDKYYEDYDKWKAGWKGFETLASGILNNYEK